MDNLQSEEIADLFVPRAESLELKKLGFDKPCFGFFSAIKSENNKFLWATSSIEHIIEFNKKAISFFDDSIGDKARIQHFIQNSYSKNTVTAPTYQQAFDFFREKYKLKHDIDDDGKGTKFYYRIKSFSDMFCNYEDILKPMRQETDWDKIEFKSYREAEVQCLRELIEIVKKTKTKWII